MKVRGIGGGSTYTPELVIGFSEHQDVLPLSELALMDISEERLSIVGGFAQRTIRSAGDPFTVALPTDRRAALAGASYVVTLLIPLGSVLISAFKEHSAVVLNPAALPTSIDFDNFARAAERASLIDAMVHTVIIVVFTELLNLVVSYLQEQIVKGLTAGGVEG